MTKVMLYFFIGIYVKKQETIIYLGVLGIFNK